MTDYRFVSLNTAKHNSRKKKEISNRVVAVNSSPAPGAPEF